MSSKSLEVIWKTVCCLTLALVFAALMPRSVAAQDLEKCDDSSRANFAEAVAAGASEEELEARFGHCREEEDASGGTSGESAGKGLTSSFEKIKFVSNYNTTYERMNGCGYHPQAEMVACDVEIRQFGGYGGYPWGTFEHVRFCLDCDRNGTWDYSTLGFVHVTDNAAPGPTPSWYHLAYATTFAAPALCTNNDGRQTNVRVILSWALSPGDCGFRPYWGNSIDFTARRDP